MPQEVGKMEIFDIIFLVGFFIILSAVYGLMATYAEGIFRISFLAVYTIIGCTGIAFGIIGDMMYPPIGNIDAVAFKQTFPKRAGVRGPRGGVSGIQRYGAGGIRPRSG